MAKKQTSILVDGIEIKLLKNQKEDFISMTDIAKKFGEPRIIIQNWMRTRGTLHFLGVWEDLYNPDFNRIEFDAFIKKSGTNAFTMSPTKWIKSTNATGLITKSGRYGGGTLAHKDIAFEFCSWLDPIFKLFLIKEFQRLKEVESNQNSIEWNVHRIMAKANYKIQTEAVRTHLIPPRIQNTKQEGYAFASEADLVNKALFGLTAKEWKLANPKAEGNMRDNATSEQLLVLSNMQSLNAKLMKWGCDAKERLKILNEAAIEEMEVLISNSSLNTLSGDDMKLLDK